jgi:hypothetical protein
MPNDNVIDLSPERIARLRNLRPYRDKTDEYIREALIAKSSKPVVKSPKKSTDAPKEKTYDSRFNEKMKLLLKEFEIDMNSSSDKEALNMLVRTGLQIEDIDKEITELQKGGGLSKDDSLKLKALGDFKRQQVMSVTDISDKLGISRKQRKEKATDDIPQWIDSVLERAKQFYDGKTVAVECPKCMIELFRYWENFPKEQNDIKLNLTCWKCREQIVYIG